MGREIPLFVRYGTGQRRRTLHRRAVAKQIYRAYRATRCGPTLPSTLLEQLLLRPGIGRSLEALGFGATRTKLYNLVIKRRVLGLPEYYMDCYALSYRNVANRATRHILLGLVEEHIRVRCVAAVLACVRCSNAHEKRYPCDATSAHFKEDAEERSEKYKHVSSPNDKKYVPQRCTQPKRFRSQQGSENDEFNTTYPTSCGL